MKDDYYTSILRERNADEASASLADLCRKKDAEIAALIEARASDNRASDKMIAALQARIRELEELLKNIASDIPDTAKQALKGEK